MKNGGRSQSESSQVVTNPSASMQGSKNNISHGTRKEMADPSHADRVCLPWRRMQLYGEGWDCTASLCPVLHPLTSASWGKAPGLITH